MSAGPRKGAFLLLLLSSTLLSHLALAELKTVDRRPSRFTAQIAHHTELPYIRDPPEPSNDVDEPFPDYDHTSASPINGDDTASTTERQANNEANEIHAADGLGVPGPLLHPGHGDAGSAAASLMVTGPTRSTAHTPYDLPNPPLQYRPEHQRYRYSPRPASFVRTFTCTFENHTCGMRNQKIIGPHFQLVSNGIAQRKGRYMAVNAQRVPAGVSRLITPYLPGHSNAVVCLQLTYLVYGPGAERIQVVAQDVGNRPLFTLERLPTFAWRTFAINMTVHQDLRFFIEAYTNANPGMIAFDDFTYSFDPCH